MTTLVDVPTRVDGVELIGEMVGSGYRTPPALVRRADGQVLQLTPLLYLVLQAADGRRSCAEIAGLVGRALGRGMTDADVQTLIDSHLRPLGLLQRADGAEPELKRSNPLVALRPRVAVTNPRTTRRLTDPFRWLFRPAIWTVFVLAFVAVVGWVFFERGLGASAYDAFERPHLLLLVFVVSVLSGGFHEFGHAAAARYSGATPGSMGAGLYLVWPAFYTDVTDSYRLGRRGRIRTDLGGLYFNAIVAVLTFVWWWATGWEALLLLVATQVLQMTQQLLPLLRFDGYHLLADLAGVPDLYQRIRPTLAGLLPHRWRSSENRVLKPGARALITGWVLVTVPMLVLMLGGMVLAVPRLLGSAGQAIREDAGAVTSAQTDGHYLDATAHVFQVLAVLLPAVGCALVLGRLGYRFFVGLARWGQGSMVRRALAALTGAVVVTALLWAWWPHPGTYRPLEADEHSLVGFLDEGQQTPARAAPRTPVSQQEPAIGAAARSRLATGEPLVAAFEKGVELPSRQHPTLAMVLVPTTDGTATDGAAEDAWVFPFDRPLLPGTGDNQALAVTTTDGSVSYDIAFALVWAEGDEVLNVNEAHAYASCSDCVAVAVAFQVVLIKDDARVIVPQNLAVAANYDCYRCITAALATQLVLSVSEETGEEELRALAEVWNRLTRFAQQITSYSLAEIRDQLTAFEIEIIEILGVAPREVATATTAPPSSSPTGGPSDPSPSPTASPPRTEEPPASPTPTPVVSPSPNAPAPTSSSPSEPTTPDSPTGSTASP